jgi:hypothetical protein
MPATYRDKRDGNDSSPTARYQTYSEHFCRIEPPDQFRRARAFRPRKTMTNGSQSQPDEIERVACSVCGGFLRLETSMPESVGHPRYDIMRCVSCEFSQWIADESSSAEPVLQAARTLTQLRASVSCSASSRQRRTMSSPGNAPV